MNIRFFTTILISLFLTIILSLVVYAGCCINDNGLCAVATSAGSCSGDYFSEQCSVACVKGCCCDSSGSAGTVTFQSTCNEIEFVEDTSLTLGESCSCTAEQTYSISGTVVEKDNPSNTLANAIVTAGGISTTSTSGGAYTLNNVPEGSSVVVAARKEGCLSASTTINLNSNKNNIRLELNCQCEGDACDADSNARCISSKWIIYNLFNADKKEEYCSFCAVDDPSDCGMGDVCKDDDYSCPVDCSDKISDGELFDSDCVCSIGTNNGVCPNHCTAKNDADCNIFSHSCGDRLVTFPYETCEKAPSTGQRSLCSGDVCVDCVCVGDPKCGNLIIDSGESCEVGWGLCADGSYCENCDCGEKQCTGDNMNPDLALSFKLEGTTKKIIIDWSLTESCVSDVSNYVVYKCHKTTGGSCLDKDDGFSILGDLYSGSLSKIEDADITQTSEYCYFLKSVFIDGEVGESDIGCVQTGHYYCMDLSADERDNEFCMENERKKCDENFNIQQVESCGSGKFCMGPNNDGITRCEAQGICDLCNGLYGMYSHFDLKVSYEEGGYLVSKFCHPASSWEQSYYPSGRQVVEGCYIDRTKTLFTAFKYCSDVTSCYDYKSEEACIDSLDPCAKNEGCEWNWYDEFVPELGGVCRPQNPQLQKCELCDNDDYNWITPSCTASSCDLFGVSCYYQGKSTTRINAPTCSGSLTAACLDYPNAQDCGTSVSVHASYDSDGITRIGGTHRVTPSTDKLGLGKCFWDDVNNRCMKNADNNPSSDCRIGDFYCESDFSNPETVIIPSSFGIYPADVLIRFSVNDNYPASKINTYFCISPVGSWCYPDEIVVSSRETYSKTLTSSGKYLVWYYSEDSAKNIEEVKNVTITVDTEWPRIDLTNPANASTFPTNQLIVSAQGIVATDAKYVCAKNKNTDKTFCVHNCVLSKDKNCFSDTNGKFTIDIPIGTDEISNVILFSEDFAGNTYSNTLFGILYDAEPPSKPEISVLEEV